MIRALPQRSGYSRAERISDGIVHIVGLVAVVIAVPLLILQTLAQNHSASIVASTAVYGTTLIAMILCSALYNMVGPGVWTNILRRLDHSAIYFKIAGTYTLFTVMSGGYGTHLLAALWTTALAGTGLRVFCERTHALAGDCSIPLHGMVGGHRRT